MVTDSARYVISPGTRAVADAIAWTIVCSPSRITAVWAGSRWQFGMPYAAPNPALHAALQPQPSRHRRLAPRWATLPACASNPATSPSSPTTEEIEIETARPDGPPHRTIIWVVVDGDDAFVRSVNGAGGTLVSRGGGQPVGHHPRRRAARSRRASWPPPTRHSVRADERRTRRASTPQGVPAPADARSPTSSTRRSGSPA